MENKQANTAPSPSYENATGKIDYTFTNDYMFRVLLQKKQPCPEGIDLRTPASSAGNCKSIKITNPIRTRSSN